MKIIFMGSPDFAVPCLEELLKSPHDLAAVVTQPDRPKGRGKKLTPTPVKEIALKKGIPILQPEKVNSPEFIKLIKEAKPDLIVVVAFGQILKPELLDIPFFGCINVHASLLPQYRGAAPIHWAIINGEKETGVTTMFLDPGMDTGDMILKETVAIGPDDNVGLLHDRLASAGARVLRETIGLLEAGQIIRIPQKQEEATYAPPLKREHEMIHWDKNAKEIHDQVRGMNPWPGAYTILNGTRLKIWETCLHEDQGRGVPGQVLEVGRNHGILVRCQSGSLWLTEVQPQGSRRMAGDAFARGYRVEKGGRFGSGRE